jgi:addiction module RelE/StbE family toxin
MYNLKWHLSFQKAYERRVKNNLIAQSKIKDTLSILVENPFDNRLKTHKLHGILKGLYACAVDYDLRLVFTIDRDESDTIILIDIGTHDEVY